MAIDPAIRMHLEKELEKIMDKLMSHGLKITQQQKHDIVHDVMLDLAKPSLQPITPENIFSDLMRMKLEHTCFMASQAKLHPALTIDPTLILQNTLENKTLSPAELKDELKKLFKDLLLLKNPELKNQTPAQRMQLDKQIDDLVNTLEKKGYFAKDNQNKNMLAMKLVLDFMRNALDKNNKNDLEDAKVALNRMLTGAGVQGEVQKAVTSLEAGNQMNVMDYMTQGLVFLAQIDNPAAINTDPFVKMATVLNQLKDGVMTDAEAALEETGLFGEEPEHEKHSKLANWPPRPQGPNGSGSGSGMGQ